LCTAIQRDRLVLRKPRQVRFDMTKEYVGKHYSEEGAAKPVPMNLLAMYCSVVGRKMVANEPRVMLSTPLAAAKPTVSAMMDFVNQQIKKQRLANTLQRCVFDSFFMLGICKVALADPAEASLTGWQVKAGQPLAMRIDPDDFVYDTHARDLSEADYVGHRYRAPWRVLKRFKQFGKKAQNIVPTEDKLFNLEGDERISVIGRTFYSDQLEFEDHVDLWEIYLPKYRRVVTLLDDNLTGASAMEQGGPGRWYDKALRIQPWIGMPHGPYHYLSMMMVPGNPMPKAPLHDLYDMHLAINQMLRKLIWQGTNFKDLMLVQGQADADGQRVIETDSGSLVRVDNPESLKQALYNVPNTNVFQLVMALKDAFSWLAGNMEIMGGLGAQSRTATQDEMLNTNSSATISEMQDRVFVFTSGVSEALAWYWKHDPISQQHSVYTLPGSSQTLKRTVSPQQRMQLDWDDIKLNVDPYSLQHLTPSSKMQAVNTIVTQMMAPLMPLLQAQGFSLDMHKLLDLYAGWTNIPELAEILGVQPPPQQQGQAGPPTAAGPASTTRNYTRRSEAGPSNKGKALMQGNAMQAPSTNGATAGAGIG
jgi:hypothetical protein